MKDNTLTSKLQGYATGRHAFVNQSYGDKPYHYHLKMVYDMFEKFKHLIDEVHWDLVGAACWGHDLIEDTRVTYSDVGKTFGWDLAELIFCCTEQRGRTRDERHGEDYFRTLSENRLAVFVKLCDICANYKNSSEIKHSMYMKYKKELPKVKEKLYKKGEYDEIWGFLESL